MSRYTLALLSWAMIAAGCDGPWDRATAPELPAADVSPSPQVHVLNTQLRGIINPDIAPSPAYGHVHIKLTDNGDDTYSVGWSGRIFNPAGETFTSGIVGIIDPDIEPPPAGGEEDPPILVATPVLTFFRLGTDGVSCGVIDFDSQGIIDPQILPAEVALRVIINPEIHVASFVTTQHATGAIAGSFGAGSPEQPVGESAAGARVRCAI